MMSKILKTTLVLLSFSFISGNQVHAQNLDAIVDAAVANPNRAETNSVRDPLRMPGDVIKFMGVKPGDTVLDMVSKQKFLPVLLAMMGG